MSKIRILIELLLFFSVLVLAVTFAIANPTSVVIDVLFAQFSVQIGIIMLFVFLVGGALGFLARLPSSLVLRAKVVSLEKKLRASSADS